ncbi:CinA family protein [Legionella saoudiensis]|uniref:CinA family protein n=1 Tax=Legionella saoudiensis TaxID=1750561 RepID=UPI0007309AE0|nr:CinA family protein [Legionella saoudiensis]
MNSLILEIATLLQKKNWQLVTAESCTGGLVSGYLTEIPGSSIWFERGFVTYSNQAKQEMLGVSNKLLLEYGAVSEPVAAAMAIGAIQNSAGQIALSVTGIAGPDGGSIEKPVGTVCFGWFAQGMSHAQTVRRQFSGTRQEIRLAACQEALTGVCSLLKNIPIDPA